MRLVGQWCPLEDADVMGSPDLDACEKFHPSVAAQRLEQDRIANELRALDIAVGIAGGRVAGAPVGILNMFTDMARDLQVKIRGSEWVGGDTKNPTE